MPIYKDQIERLRDRDLANCSFLGDPLLQAADILIYKAAFVHLGEDQALRVELTREEACRFAKCKRIWRDRQGRAAGQG
jgi:tryptophanyl-tRNA synthetase